MITLTLKNAAEYRLVQHFGNELVYKTTGFTTEEVDEFIGSITDLYNCMMYMTNTNRENLTALTIEAPTVLTTLNVGNVNVSETSNMKLTSGLQAYVNSLANLV